MKRSLVLTQASNWTCTNSLNAEISQAEWQGFEVKSVQTQPSSVGEGCAIVVLMQKEVSNANI